MHPKKPTSLFRYVSAVLLTALLLFPFLSLSVYALTPYSYNMSADYKSSRYYSNLKAIELTGNGAADVLAVAMSQLGYHEGNSTSDFEGLNASGSKNFVEYNRLYGKLDNNEGNGYSYGYAWCASFVNWSLRQAGIDVNTAGGEVSCSRWIREFLKPNGIWEASEAHGGDYVPKAGDLIFFKKSGSSALSTHVGLVRYTDGTYVHTVEGNTASGAVALDAYLLDSSYVIGYGTPDYDTGNSEVCDYGDSGKIAGLYIVTADALNIREKASSSSNAVGGLDKADLITVEGFESGFAQVVTAGGTEGYVSARYLELVTVPPPETFTVTFLDSDGTTVLSALECEAGVSPTPPTVPSFERDGFRYSLVGWSEPLAPVTGNAFYTAVYESEELSSGGGDITADTDAPSDSDGESGTAETDGDGTQSGCGASVGPNGLLLLVFLPLSALPLLRKRVRKSD